MIYVIFLNFFVMLVVLKVCWNLLEVNGVLVIKNFVFIGILDYCMCLKLNLWMLMIVEFFLEMIFFSFSIFWMDKFLG